MGGTESKASERTPKGRTERKAIERQWVIPKAWAGPKAKAVNANGRDQIQRHGTPMCGTESKAIGRLWAGPAAKALDAYGRDRFQRHWTPMGGTENRISESQTAGPKAK